MKLNRSNHTFFFLLATCFSMLFFMVTTKVLAQEEDVVKEKLKTRLSLTCIQKSTSDIDLQAVLKAKKEKQYITISDNTIEFYSFNDSIEVLLGESVTEENGIATLNITTPSSLLLDTAGYVNVIARYNGNDTLKPKEKDFEFKRAYITVTADDSDSLKTLIVTAKELDTDQEIPIEDADVTIYTPRLFSLLKIGKGNTNKRGKVEIIIPDDLPANKPTGELNVIAKVEDSDDYGYLETSLEANWGIPFSSKLDKSPRALWSSNPPLWMVIAFIVMMAAVWGHFVVIIVKLIQIKKTSSKENISNKKII